MTRAFTAHDAKTMTPEQVVEFWRKRQTEDRAAGRDHYTVLIDAATNEVVCAID